MRIHLRETTKLTECAARVAFCRTKMKEMLEVRALNCFNLIQQRVFKDEFAANPGDEQAAVSENI